VDKHPAIHAKELSLEPGLQNLSTISSIIFATTWNTLIDQPRKIMSIARRDWARVGTQCEHQY